MPMIGAAASGQHIDLLEALAEIPGIAGRVRRASRNRYDGFDATVVWLGPYWTRCMVGPSGTKAIASA